jgi:hypothetical protein
MSLFVVQHRHDAERCPARDPNTGAMLLQHLSPGNARQSGLTIHGEAVVNNAHTFYMIVDAPDRTALERFMQPFARAGTVEIWPASPCEAVVARRGCEGAAG